MTGLTLPGLLHAESEARKKSHRATAKSVILLFQFGGASHLDSFDPKPNAPSEIRGEFKTIPTKVPGYLVTEHLPRLVEIATADLCHQTNPRPCTAADFERLFKAAL